MRVGTPKSHISALLAGNRGVGDDLAAKLEAKMEKPPGWMDSDLVDLAAGLDLEASRKIFDLATALEEIRELDPQRFERIASNIEELLSAMRKTDTLLRDQHGVTGYVTAERAEEKLGGKPKVNRRQSPSEEGLRGGMISGLGDLDDAVEGGKK